MTIPEAKRRWQTIDGFVIDTMRVMECRPQRPEASDVLYNGTKVAGDLDALTVCPTCGAKARGAP